MFKDIHLLAYLKYSAIAAILYCIPVIFFVRNATYNDAWLLYIGNGLFLFVIAVFMLFFNKKKNEDATTSTMLIAGHVTTLVGIIIACILCLVILMIYVPGLFHSGTSEKVLTMAPAGNIKDNTNGLNFMVFINAVIGNISTGSFASIIFSFTAKRDQTKESTSISSQKL